MLEAYVRILGRRVAFLAVVGNKNMLLNANSVDEIEAIVADITRLAGRDGGSRILYREPSVLYCSPAAVAESIAALEETLGSAAAAFALGRNPALLQGGRAAHIRVALQTLQDILGGDGPLAAELVQKNTMLLGTNAETMRAAFDALCAMFGGPEAAIALIRGNPGLLRTRVSTLYESIEALADIFGTTAAAADAVNLNRSLLKARPDTLRGSFEALQQVYGSVEAARAVARMQLGVLRSNPSTIRAAHRALREACGEAAARSMIEMTPGLLQIRPAALRYNLAHFKAFLGDERASAMADSMPHLIKMRVGRAAEVTAAMLEVYGSNEAAAANCVRAPFTFLACVLWRVLTWRGRCAVSAHVPADWGVSARALEESQGRLWRQRAGAYLNMGIDGCIAALCRAWCSDAEGAQSAREVVMADPQLLTCLTWEATLARLKRTGVVALLPAEGEPPPLAQQAPPSDTPRRRGNPSGAGRVKEPQRAAKTVKGAMEVAAAVARARRAGKQ